jgi:hypothetical protein
MSVSVMGQAGACLVRARLIETTANVQIVTISGVGGGGGRRKLKVRKRGGRGGGGLTKRSGAGDIIRTGKWLRL